MSAVLVLLAIPLLPIQGSESRAPEEVAPYLRIDGEPITVDEFGRWLLAIEGEYQAREYALRAWVVSREAARLGLEVPDEEVERAVESQIGERITGAFLGSREGWLAELSRTGRTESGVLRQRFVEMRPELEARAIAALDRVVPGHLIRREWELRHGRNGRRHELRMMRFQVVVPSLPDMSREEWNAGREKAMEAGREQARAARERVLSGEDFGLVASRGSDDPDTRDHRGMPSGGFSHVGWPSSFLDVVEALAPGEVSPPTYARGGFWIVEMRSVRVTPLEEVRREIEADLVARGPEPYEVGLVQSRLAEGVHVQVLPSLLTEPSAEEWPSARDPAMLIEGEPVTRGEYARWLFDAQGEALVGAFVQEWLLRRRAQAAGIDVLESEVEERTRAYVSAVVDRGYRGERGAWIAYLERGGRSEEAFLRRIARRMRIDLVTEKLILRERRVGPADVRARFADAYGADGRRIEVRMILLEIKAPDLPAGLTREELARRMEEASAATQRRAEAIVERVRAGEDFASIARAASEDPATRDLGGAMPDRFRPDQWSDAIATAVAALRPFEVTDPVLFGSAWIVFQIASERQVAFEEVERELEGELRVARASSIELASYRNALLKEARVERQPVTSR